MKFSTFIMNYYVIGRSYTCLVIEYDTEISSLGPYDSEDFRWLYGYIDQYDRLMCFFKSGRPFALGARKNIWKIELVNVNYKEMFMVSKCGKRGHLPYILFIAWFQAWKKRRVVIRLMAPIKFSHFIMNYVVCSSSTCLVTKYDAEISSLGLYDSEDFRWLYGYIDLYVDVFFLKVENL